MTYEEKRELRVQISQLLADAGLNQGELKRLVKEAINAKVDQAVKQGIDHLDAQTYNHDYIKTCIIDTLNSRYTGKSFIEQAVKEELKNRVINVTLCGLEDVTVVK